MEAPQHIVKKSSARIYFWFFPLLAYILLVAMFIKDSQLFERFHLWFLFINGVLVLGFFILVVKNLYALQRSVAQKKPGSRFTRRLVMVVVGLMLIPSILLYVFSAWLIRSGIDEWFHIDVALALKNSLSLNRHVLDQHLSELEKKTKGMQETLSQVPEELIGFTLQNLLNESGASEISIYNGRLESIISVSADVSHPLFSTPPAELTRDISVENPYVGIDAISDDRYFVRLVYRLLAGSILVDNYYFLQVLYPASDLVSTLAQNVEKSYKDYNRLSFLRNEFEQNAVLALTLVLLTSVLGAGWIAFLSAHRITRPIALWVAGTHLVAEGRLDVHIEQDQDTDDELGNLVHSFNDMTKKLSIAKDVEKNNRLKIEQQRSFLEAVIQHMSSGVMVFDRKMKLQSANVASEKILKIPFSSWIGSTLSKMSTEHDVLSQFDNLVKGLSSKYSKEKKMFVLQINKETKRVNCFAALLHFGEVMLLFDDITEVMHYQRHIAWSEVARRMAHEFKNPLTPIQLSAERLRDKFIPYLATKPRATSERLITIILQQVDSMKHIVNDFRQYENTAPLQFQILELNNFIRDIVDSYQFGSASHSINCSFSSSDLFIHADRGRLRQLLYNIITNAREAVCDQDHPLVSIQISGDEPEKAVLKVTDNGSGFDLSMMDRLLEPYVTTKQGGTGLGLAIAKRIVEEHQGEISLSNCVPVDSEGAAGGAQVTLKFKLEE